MNHELWPEDYERWLYWVAHMVQRPYEYVNFGYVLSGAQGIGKDLSIGTDHRSRGSLQRAANLA